MLNFLIAVDFILSILIIGSVFIHNGADGFMGETTPTKHSNSGPKFDSSDKIVAILLALFFIVNLSINYIILYKDHGTARIDDILDSQKEKKIQEERKKIVDNIGAQNDAPLAE